MVRLGQEIKLYKARRKVSLGLFPHNQYAYGAACRLLGKEGRAAVIHPTGTGKSFIAFQLVLDNPEAAVLWLSPSSYIFQMQLENLRESLGLRMTETEAPEEGGFSEKEVF